MTETLRRKAMRAAYRCAVGTATLAALPFRRLDELAVFYAGARPGDFGGTLVKVRLLQARFPQRRFGFSLVYMLSNAIYLPQFAVDAVRAAGVPVVLNQNGVFYRGWFPNGWERENARMAQVHAAADHVFYQSEFCRRSAERFLGPRAGSSEILYNGVDTDFFVPWTGPRLDRPFTFVTTGKFDTAMGYRLTSAIDGLAAARRGGLDVRLDIAGVMSPDVAITAHAQIGRLGVSDAVSLKGPYSGSQAPAIYQAADAYLMTKHNDPCPNAVLEALACGLPVLYSASGGVPEQVGDRAGIGLPVPETFEVDVTPDPTAMAEGMARVIHGRAAMAQAARERAVACFDLKDWLNRHDAVFHQQLKKTS
jgi:glycosyltransferase involved in cell wall biosynthesis